MKKDRSLTFFILRTNHWNNLYPYPYHHHNPNHHRHHHYHQYYYHHSIPLICTYQYSSCNHQSYYLSPLSLIKWFKQHLLQPGPFIITPFVNSFFHSQAYSTNTSNRFQLQSQSQPQQSPPSTDVIRDTRRTAFIASLKISDTVEEVNKYCDSFLLFLKSLPVKPSDATDTGEYATQGDYRAIINALMRVGDLERAKSIFTEMDNRRLTGKGNQLMEAKLLYAKIIKAIKKENRNSKYINISNNRIINKDKANLDNNKSISPTTDRKGLEIGFVQRQMLSVAAGIEDRISHIQNNKKEKNEKANSPLPRYAEALDIFHKLQKNQSIPIDIATYNHMAHILNLAKEYHLTRDLYRDMIHHQIKPNAVTYLNLLQSYCHQHQLLNRSLLPIEIENIKEDIRICVELVEEMLDNQIKITPTLLSLAVRSISLVGGNELIAKRLFKQMKVQEIPMGINVFVMFLLPVNSPEFQLMILLEGRQYNYPALPSPKRIFGSLFSSALQNRDNSSLLYFLHDFLSIDSSGRRRNVTLIHKSDILCYLEEGILICKNDDLQIMMLLYNEMRNLKCFPSNDIIRSMIIAASRKKDLLVCQKLINDKRRFPNYSITAVEYYAYVSAIENNLIKQQTAANETLSEEKQSLVDGLQAQLMTVLLMSHSDGATYLTVESGKMIVQFTSLTHLSECLDALRLLFRWIEFEGQWFGDKSLTISIRKEIKVRKGKPKEHLMSYMKLQASNSLYSLFSSIYSFLSHSFHSLSNQSNRLRFILNDKESTIKIDDKTMLEWQESRRRRRKLGVNLVEEDETVEDKDSGEQRLRVKELRRKAEVGVKKLIQVKAKNLIKGK